MSEHKRPKMDPSWLRGMTQRRMSRRDMLRTAGVGAGTLSMAAILAACSSDEGGTTDTGDNNDTSPFDGQTEELVNFANWPLYIDKSRNSDGDVIYPSLVGFTKETGIEVNYQEVIQSNPEFFGRIQPQLSAGDDTEWDIIVLTNGRELTAMQINDWVVELDPSKRPNFDANAADFARDPVFDPGNKFTMAWQSGITGIGVNTELVDADITSMDDLADPAKVGTNSVGMLKDDMPDFVMINLGIDPATSGPDEWKQAADWLMMQREAGTVRKYYDQGYFDDFTAGNLPVTMGWSGDVLYGKLWLGEPFEFIFPEGGALLWIDNMMIPANAAHPDAAYALMDYVYQPDVAQGITEWVLYMSPVPEVQEMIAEHAKEAEADGDKGYANKLQQTADSEFLWPTPEFLSNTKFAKDLRTDEEIQEWDAIFLPISEG
ncbi:MAG: spermidine/putrescine ABC transporter substrate-binding protein [Actinomycetota bacterium]